MSFGRKMKTLREENGLSGAALSRLIGLSQGHISKIEADQCPPPGEAILVAMAKVFRLDPDELFCLAGVVPSDIATAMTSSIHNMKSVRSLLT